MAKKDSANLHLVQAYQSPYNNELYPLDKKGEFEKHLRQEERLAKERAVVEAATDARKSVWAALRASAQSMDDVTRLLNALPSEMTAHYRKKAFFKSAGDAGWTLTMKNAPKLGMQSISHESSLNENTNWCSKDKTRPGYLLGLSGDAQENLNYLFAEARRESGLNGCNNRYTLFAEDWPFVAKMALLKAFDKTIELPEKYERANGAPTDKLTVNYIRFWQDIERYSLLYTGMSYSELQGMRDSLGLAKDDLVAMMASRAMGPSTIPNNEMAFALPDGTGSDCMQSPT